MTLFGFLATGALLLSASAEDAAPPRYDLVCDGAIQPAFCAALHGALSENGYEAEIVVAPTPTAAAIFHFQIDAQNDHVLSGRLTWSAGDGHGEGPVFELAAMDNTIQDEMLQMFARQVVRLTPMPE